MPAINPYLFTVALSLHKEKHSVIGIRLASDGWFGFTRISSRSKWRFCDKMLQQRHLDLDIYWHFYVTPIHFRTIALSIVCFSSNSTRICFMEKKRIYPSLVTMRIARKSSILGDGNFFVSLWPPSLAERNGLSFPPVCGKNSWVKSFMRIHDISPVRLAGDPDNSSSFLPSQRNCFSIHTRDWYGF